MSLRFDGTSGALRATANPSFSYPLIIMGWFNSGSPGAGGLEQTIWTRQNASAPSTKYSRIFLTSAGVLKFERVETASSRSCTVSVGGVTAEVWYHFAVYDDGLDRAIWLNGASKGTDSGTISQAVQFHCCIGARETNPTTPVFDTFFEGYLAEFQEIDNDADGGGTPLWTQDNVEAVALGLYKSGAQGGKIYRLGGTRYTPLEADEYVSRSMPNANAPSAFGATGTVVVGDKAPNLWTPGVDGALIRRKGALKARRSGGVFGANRIVGAQGVRIY